MVKAVRGYAAEFHARGAAAVSRPPPPRKQAGGGALHQENGADPNRVRGSRLFAAHERRFALRLLNAVLGENMSSRLFQTVREDQGLAYSIYSGNSFFDDTGDLVISAGLDLANLEKTLKIILRELKRLREEPVRGGGIGAGARLPDRPA